MTQRGVGPFGHTPSPAPAEPARYRLGSRLDDAGQVYEAHNSRYAGRLVVKLFPYAASLAPAAVAAFTREAGRVADLRHPHVVQVIHASVFADGTPFAAMEQLYGQTLDRRIAGRGALPASEVLPLVRGMASALSAAHAVDVVHREVRADNVFIADMAGYPDGFVKLLDFGVSRLTAAARAAGRIVGPGTLRALAPEQGPGAGTGDRPGDRADQRTDQFALAALTHRLLTGAEPFVGQDAGPAFERLREDENGGAAGFVRSTPAVAAVLNKAMSKRPENRFDTVARFFQAFEEALTGKVAAAVPAPSVEHDAPTVLLAVGKPAVTVGSGDAAARPVVASGSGDAAATPVRAITEPVDVSSATMRATVAPVGSLTQQFFAEGDRQEASQWAKAAILEEDEFGEDRDFGDGEFHDAYERVPKKRVPLIAAAVVVALGVGAWATNLWSPFAWFSSPAPKTAPPSIAVTPDRPAPGATPAGPVAAVPPTTRAQPAPPVTAVPAAPAAAPAPVAPVARAAAPAPVARVAAPTPVARAAAPAPVAPVARVADPVPVAPVAPAAPAMAAPLSPPPLAPDTPAANPAGQPKTPLRGYTWSARRRRLIRAQLAPLPTESPPPPSLSASPVSPDSLLPPATLMIPADSTPPAPPSSAPPAPPAAESAAP